MRYTAAHKQRTREKVLGAAAKAIRASGPEGVGVAGIMADAGLTHGGFYAHFASKDDLIAAAIARMFEESRARLEAETRDRTPDEGLRAYIDFYLSPAHRDARRAGCPLAALASDLPRMKGSARKKFSDEAAALVSRLAERIALLDREDPDADASSTFAELLGALSLARIESNVERSDALLASSRHAIKRRLGLIVDATQ